MVSWYAPPPSEMVWGGVGLAGQESWMIVAVESMVVGRVSGTFLLQWTRGLAFVVRIIVIVAGPAVSCSESHGVEASEASVSDHGSFATTIGEVEQALAQPREQAVTSLAALGARQGALHPQTRALAILAAADLNVDPASARSQLVSLTSDPKVLTAYRLDAAVRLGVTPCAGQFRSGALRQLRDIQLAAAANRTVVVAPSGRDDSRGTLEEPVQSLEEALARIGRLASSPRRKQGEPLSLRVVLRQGRYWVPHSIMLNATSLPSGVSLSIQGFDGESVIVTGGRQLTNFIPLADDDIRRHKFKPAARARIVVSDLRKAGITDYGTACGLGVAPDLFSRSVPQTLARWPNDGFARSVKPATVTETVQAGMHEDWLQVVEKDLRPWANVEDLFCHGYLYRGTRDEYRRVLSIDDNRGALGLGRTKYPSRVGARFYVTNAASEIDSPGEWYLDRSAGRLYWYPDVVGNVGEFQAEMSCTSGPLLACHSLKRFELSNVTLECGRGEGVRLVECEDCVVADCHLANLGGTGIRIEGGKRNSVLRTVIQDVGAAGIYAAGGSHRTLDDGGHRIEDCTIRRVARLHRTYNPGVHLAGRSARVANCLLEDMPSSAIRADGADHVIEYNLIRKVGWESEDQGAIDVYGDVLFRNLLIRCNHFIDIQGPDPSDADITASAAIRLDDFICGALIIGNVFQRCGYGLFGAIQIHGGKENVIDRNIFVECPSCVSFTMYSPERWAESMKQHFFAIPEELIRRYPTLARLEDDVGVNWITRNLLLDVEAPILRRKPSLRVALNVSGKHEGSALPSDLNAISAPFYLTSPSRFDGLTSVDTSCDREIGPRATPQRVSP